VFYLCERSRQDARFPKYPPLPVLQCPGFEAATTAEEEEEGLQDINGLNYFSEDRTNALNLLTNYETMTGDALNSMAQLDELQSIVSELEASGVSSPELEAEISEIESMISEQLEGDTNKDYSDTIFDSYKNKKGGN